MKVIDLLNKIANGEKLPKKIEVDSIEYNLNINSSEIYRSKEHYALFDNIYCNDDNLNLEVEIIEDTKGDKKIEKISEVVSTPKFKVLEKINEIIDKLNEMGDK